MIGDTSFYFHFQEGYIYSSAAPPISSSGNQTPFYQVVLTFPTQAFQECRRNMEIVNFQRFQELSMEVTISLIG
jgi:hypothetical protein